MPTLEGVIISMESDHIKHFLLLLVDIVSLTLIAEHTEQFEITLYGRMLGYMYTHMHTPDCANANV